MFGRRKVATGGSAATPPPPLPPSETRLPIEEMDRALDAAIRLFTRVFDDAGVACGYLALRGKPVPEDVSGLIARCTTYRESDAGNETYLTLGTTSDFKQFNFAPHCRLFLILNAIGICESPHAAHLLGTIARGQFSGPLVDAWLMRHWIHFMPTVIDTLKGGAAAQEQYFGQLAAKLGEVVSATPPDWRDEIGLRDRYMQFADGFPVGMGLPINAEVPRMNGLPMTPEIAEHLTNYLAELQAHGLSNR